MLATGDRWGGGSGERPYLPRAFSFARARPGAGGGADLQFLLEDVGPGTRRLAELAPGEALMLLGPLGAGFSPPAARRDGRARGRRHRHRADPGPPRRAPGRARGARLPLRRARGGRGACSARSPTLTTDDGSAGRQGLVTEPLRELLDADPSATVYACGPPPMLEAVRALCEERETPAQLALEAGMACGYGACFGCVVADQGRLQARMRGRTGLRSGSAGTLGPDV